MRRLEGVIDCAWLLRTDALKRHSLFFDRLHLYRPRKTRDFEYLCEQGMIADDPSEPSHKEGWRRIRMMQYVRFVQPDP
jgi:hypothetical protein